MKTLLFILLTVFAGKLAASIQPGELAVTGFETGPSVRLALVANSPLYEAQAFCVVASSSGVETEIACVRINRKVAAGEVIQVAGTYCSAGDVSIGTNARAVSAGDAIILRPWRSLAEIARTPPWAAGGGSYVGPRKVRSPDEAERLLDSAANWRLGPIPPQEPFTFLQPRHVPRSETFTR